MADFTEVEAASLDTVDMAEDMVEDTEEDMAVDMAEDTAVDMAVDTVADCTVNVPLSFSSNMSTFSNLGLNKIKFVL